jgi:hypothetical protein
MFVRGHPWAGGLIVMDAIERMGMVIHAASRAGEKQG